MIKKLLEKEVEVLTDENQILFNFPIKLEYYLLESECEEIEELKGEKIFGIEVIKKVEGIKEEVMSFKEFSSNFEVTKKILNTLAKNSVTPIELPYVLEDMIG
jgi:hypothetical protein